MVVVVELEKVEEEEEELWEKIFKFGRKFKSK
jgi:hypothetical protein